MEIAAVHIASPEPADAPRIGQMHLQACLETYPNLERGIDADWILNQWGSFATEDGTQHRLGIIVDAMTNPNILYRVATIDGEIAGFIHATRTDDHNVLEGLYVLKEFHGEAVAAKLMAEFASFVDQTQPTELEVAADNGRAIAFYKKYGFYMVDGSERLHHDRIPVVKMCTAQVVEPPSALPDGPAL